MPYLLDDPPALAWPFGGCPHSVRYPAGHVAHRLGGPRRDSLGQLVRRLALMAHEAAAAGVALRQEQVPDDAEPGSQVGAHELVGQRNLFSLMVWPPYGSVTPQAGDVGNSGEGSGQELTSRRHRPDCAQAPFDGGTPAGDIVQGRDQNKQQLLQQRSYRLAMFRQVHHHKGPRRKAGFDLPQADRAVHQQLDTDVDGC